MDENLTRKERRALAREQKKAERQTKVNINKLKKLFVLTFGIFVLSFGIYKTYKWVTTPTPQVAGEATEMRGSDWTKGNKDASVTLLEYSDYECPACASYSSIVDRLGNELGDKVKIIYRNFPLVTIHKNALPAAKAAEAAGLQGKFWEMHNLLFEKQSEWSKENNINDKLVGFAKDLGLDENKFKADFDSKEVEEKINSDIRLGTSLRINSTPTFYLNGTKLSQISGYEDLKGKVETEIIEISN
jgi:protein-disulfide isomerase